MCIFDYKFLPIFNHRKARYTRGMNIYFSGVGGVGIGPLMELAHDAGYTVAGSDIAENLMTKQLQQRGLTVSIGQTGSEIASFHAEHPIDWFVFTSAITPDNLELPFAKEHGIRYSKRDEFLAHLLREKELKLIAVAGTHGKTTTTSMLVWAFHTLGIPLSYSVGSTLRFATSGVYDAASTYFVYECDEYDRNMLHFDPYLSIITALDYDHPDTYKNVYEYKKAFSDFMEKSTYSLTWVKCVEYIENPQLSADYEVYDEHMDLSHLTLAGDHVRHNAFLVERALLRLFPDIAHEKIIAALNSFPGAERRFEKLIDNLYSDYGHHPAEIAATLQLARELSDHVVLVYQPHQNIRQHELRHEYKNCMELADEIYWLPTYLSREDPDLPVLTPQELSSELTNASSAHIAEMDDDLWGIITHHRDAGHLVLVMGAGNIDAWVRQRAEL